MAKREVGLRRLYGVAGMNRGDSTAWGCQIEISHWTAVKLFVRRIDKQEGARAVNAVFHTCWESEMKQTLHWASLFMLLGACSAGAQNFAWGSQGASESPGITPSMFLRDDNVAAVDAFLSTQSVKALKIDLPVSSSTINYIYNKYKIDYTFADFETPDWQSRTIQLVNQIRSSSGTGPAMGIGKAYVSNFGLAPLPFDSTSPASSPTLTQYNATGVNMASEGLYPGAPDFRSPASGNSTAPNLRSSLFTLPIERFSIAAASMPAGSAHVPYVTRFNNWMNNDLDSDHNPSNGFRFVTSNQLPSRGDFQAQVLHYRLRGAKGVIGLDGGVEGYTQKQFQEDISRGWGSQSTVNQVLSDPNARSVSLTTQIKADGQSKPIEDVGVVYSGAYSTSQGKMVLLMSNLDDLKHSVTLPERVGGRTLSGTYSIDPGMHEILEFGLTGMRWNLVSAAEVFVDHQRDGVGVPEPTSLGLLLLGSVGLLARRGRRK